MNSRLDYKPIKHIMNKKMIVKEELIKILTEQCMGQEWTKLVSIEKIAEDITNGLATEGVKILLDVSKQMDRHYTLSLLPVNDQSLHNKVAGYWEVCLVSEDDQIPIKFSTKVSKVLYVFFMLHPGVKYSLAGLGQPSCRKQMVNIALALYANSDMEHTKVTVKEAEDIANQLCSRFGTTGDSNSNSQRSQAFSKAKKAVEMYLGEIAFKYVIKGNSRDKYRVLDILAEDVRIPRAFLTEVSGCTGYGSFHQR